MIGVQSSSRYAKKILKTDLNARIASRKNKIFSCVVAHSDPEEGCQCTLSQNFSHGSDTAFRQFEQRDSHLRAEKCFSDEATTHRFVGDEIQNHHANRQPAIGGEHPWPLRRNPRRKPLRRPRRRSNSLQANRVDGLCDPRGFPPWFVFLPSPEPLLLTQIPKPRMNTNARECLPATFRPLCRIVSVRG